MRSPRSVWTPPSSGGLAYLRWLWPAGLALTIWVEIISQGEARYLTCGYIGPVADPDDVTILAVGPLSETASVTAAWIGL